MQSKSISSNLGTFALTFWALLCLVIFMYYPGSISQTQGANLYEFSTLPEKLSRINYPKFILDLLTSLFGMIFYGLSCVSTGAIFASIFHLSIATKDDDTFSVWVLIPTYFLIGNAIFSVLLLSLASTISLSPIFSFVILSVGLLSGITKFKGFNIPTLQINDGYEKAMIIFSLILMTATIIQSSARLSYDASSMYFAMAKLSAIRNHAEIYTQNSFPISTLHSVTQYIAVIQIFGDQAARLISWLFGALLIPTALALAKIVRSSVLVRRILPILILTSTAFVDQMGDGKVDLLGTAYSLTAVYWFVANTTKRQHDQHLYLLSGFFIGFASILRPYNTFLIGVFVLIYITQELRFTREFLCQTVWKLIWMALGAVSFALFHFLINKIILNSPFAFLNSLTNINPTAGPWDYKPESERLQKYLYLFVITFKNSGASLGNITPLVIVFLPALAMQDTRKKLKSHKEANRLAISAGLTLLVWIILIFSVVEVRYVLFLWVILFIFVAEIISGILEIQNSTLRGTTLSSIFVLLGFILIRSVYISFSTYSPLDMQKNPHCFDNVLCNHFTPINEIASKGERVLTLSAFRYYMRTDLFACSTTMDEYRELRELSYGTTESFWQTVYQMGYSYVAFDEEYARRHLIFSDSPFSNLPDWVELSPLITTSQHPRIAAYELNVSNPPVNAETVCRRDGSGNWRLQPQ